VEIPEKTWRVITEEVFSTSHGTVTLIVQDGRLIQIDKTEKIRLTPDPQGKITARTALNEKSHTNLRLKLSKMLNVLRYGQIIIVVRDNVVTQIERLEKYRVSDWEGTFGEGI